MDAQQLLDVAHSAAREAGRFLLDSVGAIRTVERKDGQETNLVTDIDKRSEEMVIAHIRNHFPDHGILAEESGSSERDAETVWVIDPLDGTTNFTHGLPIFCVSIGVVHRGELVAGVVYDPNHDEMFAATKGGGANCNGQPISVTSTSELMSSLLVTGFPYDIRKNPYNAIEHFNEFLVSSQAVRRLGSAAIDLCYVAAGRFDGFWEVSLNPWDMAAGVLLVREAGGVVTNFEGGEWRLKGREVLATNGRIHDAMAEILGKNLHRS